MTKYDVADGTRDRKGDLDVVVKRRIVERVAELALEAWMNLVQLSKTAGYLRAIGADEQPLHLEQARLRGVHKQLDGFGLTQAVGAGVSDRVDAKEIIVAGGADKTLEDRKDMRRPARYRPKLGEALLQDAFVDRRRLFHPSMLPRSISAMLHRSWSSHSTSYATIRRRSLFARWSWSTRQ